MKINSVRITDDNPALETLRRSWVTAVYSDDDGIAPMETLQEAGDALVAVALLENDVTTILAAAC